jgi:hypothetical protein
MSGRAGAKAGSDRVSFTQASAERIANAVRAVEGGDRDGSSFISAPRALGANTNKSIRQGTFTGSWDIGATKVVEFCGSTNTAEVLNLTVHIMDGAGTSTTQRSVLFSKVCGTNVAVELPLDQCKNIGGAINKIAGFSASKIQILGHDESGCLLWYEIATCGTATSA